MRFCSAKGSSDLVAHHFVISLASNPRPSKKREAMLTKTEEVSEGVESVTAYLKVSRGFIGGVGVTNHDYFV